MDDRKQEPDTNADEPEPEETHQDASQGAPQGEAGVTRAENQAATKNAAKIDQQANQQTGDEEAPKVEPGPAAAADLAAETAELKDRLLRTLAEMENLRRRSQKEREDTAKYAIANFARDILTVADNLHRALDAVPDDARAQSEELKTLAEGVGLTERDLLTALERQQIRKIDPMGEKFDHDFHEAMFEVEDGDHEPGTVVHVLELGYLIHDRLLRPARVGVAKAAPKPDDEESTHLDTTA